MDEAIRSRTGSPSESRDVAQLLTSQRLASHEMREPDKHRGDNISERITEVSASLTTSRETR